MAPMKKRVTAITNGCADSNPILVAAEADDQRMAKKIPAVVSLMAVAFTQIFIRSFKIFFGEIKERNWFWLLFIVPYVVTDSELGLCIASGHSCAVVKLFIKTC